MELAAITITAALVIPITPLHELWTSFSMGLAATSTRIPTDTMGTFPSHIEFTVW